MQTLTEIKALLAERGLAPRKSLGQNFLVDKNLLTRLIDCANLPPGHPVLEVGPGTGTLTETLLTRPGGGHPVIAAELDAGLAQLLRDRIPTLRGIAPGSFTLVEGDCLGPGRTVAPALLHALDTTPTHAGKPYALVANLPYAAATPLMIALLLAHPRCHTMAVTIQREVADRLSAKPGSDAYGTLGIVAQALAVVEPIAVLPPECFWPRPEVTSAMVKLTRRPAPPVPFAHIPDAPAAFATFCQTLFSKRRKQLGAILGRATPLPPGLDPAARPETLSVTDLLTLHAFLADQPPTKPTSSPAEP